MASRVSIVRSLQRGQKGITETKCQIERDESLLAKRDLAALTERGVVLAARIEELHRQIREIQGLETSNRETERTAQTPDAELRANMDELDRLRVEREELAIVPCRGEGPHASCPKIQRAVEAGKKISTLEGEAATLTIEVEVQRGSLVQIARVFGPDEIQLCEIQNAGPQVSILVNSLLEGCFDNKSEIRFRTQRPKADGNEPPLHIGRTERTSAIDNVFLVLRFS